MFVLKVVTTTLVAILAAIIVFMTSQSEKEPDKTFKAAAGIVLTLYILCLVCMWV